MQTTLTGVAGVLVLALLACKAPSEKKKSSSEPEISVTATELQAAYKANEARADAKYKGKVIKISGTIKSIDSDFRDKPVVRLVSGELLGVGLYGLPKSVAINLNKGDAVTYVCVGAGEAVGTPRLDDCRKP